MGSTLADISVGMTGKIAGFGKGKKEYRKKLLAMGLIKGTEFTVKRVAPMGDPVEITVRGYNLTLRKDEAAIVAVEGV